MSSSLQALDGVNVRVKESRGGDAGMQGEGLDLDEDLGFRVYRSRGMHIDQRNIEKC